MFNNLMLVMVYNNILDEEVERILREKNAKGFTEIKGISGKGETSGYHLGTDVFPDLNNMLFIVESENIINELKEEFVKLKEKYKEEGCKIFIVPVIESI